MTIFEAVLPVVAVAALGYFSRHFRILSEIETSAIERVAFWFLIPCLLFLGTATAAFESGINWQFLGAFYGVLLLVYTAGMVVAKLGYHYTWRELSVFGMAGAYANVTVLGIPITLEILGEGAFVPMFLIITFHNLLLFAFGTLIAELGNFDGSGLWRNLLRIGREMMLNPVSGSLLAGAAYNLTGIGLYGPLQDTLELLSRAAIPGALFALGAGLTRYHIRGGIRPALIMVAFKLLVLPLVMLAVMRQLDLDPLWQNTAVLLSAMPVGISVYVFSKRYSSLETAAATAIVIASLAGVLSISLIAWLLNSGL